MIGGTRADITATRMRKHKNIKRSVKYGLYR
nr:MAG TPA_asm: hypothetical protein [Bacteriophage sp.]